MVRDISVWLVAHEERRERERRNAPSPERTRKDARESQREAYRSSLSACMQSSLAPDRLLAIMDGLVEMQPPSCMSSGYGVVVVVVGSLSNSGLSTQYL